MDAPGEKTEPLMAPAGGVIVPESLGDDLAFGREDVEAKRLDKDALEFR